MDGKPDIERRTFNFSLLIVRLYREIHKDGVGQILGKQLLRAGTSVGANVHEAQAAQTKADFISKISIGHKEILETLYWLKLLKEEKIISEKSAELLIEEASQIAKVLAAILLTSKKNLCR